MTSRYEWTIVVFRDYEPIKEFKDARFDPQTFGISVDISGSIAPLITQSRLMLHDRKTDRWFNYPVQAIDFTQMKIKFNDVAHLTHYLNLFADDPREVDIKSNPIFSKNLD